MLLELVKESELWVVLPDGTNLRIECSKGLPTVVEHWYGGVVLQMMSIEPEGAEAWSENDQTPSSTEKEPSTSNSQTRA